MLYITLAGLLHKQNTYWVSPYTVFSRRIILSACFKVYWTVSSHEQGEEKKKEKSKRNEAEDRCLPRSAECKAALSNTWHHSLAAYGSPRAFLCQWGSKASQPGRTFLPSAWNARDCCRDGNRLGKCTAGIPLFWLFQILPGYKCVFPRLMHIYFSSE